jgi:hypothetical protein
MAEVDINSRQIVDRITNKYSKIDRMTIGIVIYIVIIVSIYLFVGIYTNCFQDSINEWKIAYDNFNSSLNPTVPPPQKCVNP